MDREFRGGIEGTGIRPGFLKIGVDKGRLSEIDRKLIVAAARCHGQTGLRICVHTGDGAAALDILDTLKEEGVSPEAYVWIHAQSETDRSIHVRAAEAGAWLEFDGVSPKSLDLHVAAVTDVIRREPSRPAARVAGRRLVPRWRARRRRLPWLHLPVRGLPAGASERGVTEAQIRAFSRTTRRVCSRSLVVESGVLAAPLSLPPEGAERVIPFSRIATLLLTLGPGLAATADWPQWRGPALDGTSPERGLPLRWGVQENVAWKLALPEEVLQPLSSRGPRLPDRPESRTLSLWCVGRTSGKVLWSGPWARAT